MERIVRCSHVSSLLPLGLAAVMLTGCAVNPVSGRPEPSLISASQERELGREEAKKVEASMGLVDDSPLTAYVRQVGERIATHSPHAGVDYTFYVLDLPEPNAFALPGGYVYVSRGLLALLNSEDELAGVVGHEVGHVAARHSVRRVTRAAPIGVVSGVGAAVVGMVSPVLGDVVGGVAGAELAVQPHLRLERRAVVRGQHDGRAAAEAADRRRRLRRGGRGGRGRAGDRDAGRRRMGPDAGRGTTAA